MPANKNGDDFSTICEKLGLQEDKTPGILTSADLKMIITSGSSKELILLENSGRILTGKKRETFLDAGYVYAPYVQLQTSPTIVDPSAISGKRGISSRYGKRTVNPAYYSFPTRQGDLAKTRERAAQAIKAGLERLSR